MATGCGTEATGASSSGKMSTQAALRAVLDAIKSNQESSRVLEASMEQKLEKLRKKLKEKEKCITFKRKGNEIQYKDLKLEEVAPLVGPPGSGSVDRLKKRLRLVLGPTHSGISRPAPKQVRHHSLLSHESLGAGPVYGPQSLDRQSSGCGSWSGGYITARYRCCGTHAIRLR